MTETDAIEQAIQALKDTGDHLVLRRMPRQAGLRRTSALWHPGGRVGIYLDTETTGVDADRCSVIELAMVRFRFDELEGSEALLAIEGEYQSYNDPGAPIPAEVTQLTGITDEMVRGQLLSMGRVMELLDGAELVVAHNASFDRRVVERLWRGAVFSDKQRWGCSYRDVDWRARGHSCQKLGHLLIERQREFYEAHRALDDCYAGLRLLQYPGVLRELVGAAHAPSFRVWATGAPFATKEALKQRNYRWDGERRKCWYKDLRVSDPLEEELTWLHALAPNPDVQRITAYDRYSARA